MLCPQMEIRTLVQRRVLNSMQKILVEKNDGQDDYWVSIELWNIWVSPQPMLPKLIKSTWNLIWRFIAQSMAPIRNIHSCPSALSCEVLQRFLNSSSRPPCLILYSSPPSANSALPGLEFKYSFLLGKTPLVFWTQTTNMSLAKYSHLSMAHCIVEYAMMRGGAQYRICWRVRRKVLKIALLRAPARGLWRFGDKA